MARLLKVLAAFALLLGAGAPALAQRPLLDEIGPLNRPPRPPPPAPTRRYIPPGEPMVRGAPRLNRKTVQGVIDAHQRELEGCFTATVAPGEIVSGTLTSTWRVRPDGRVKAARLRRASVDLQGRRGLTDCVLAVVAGMRFPEPGGEKAHITYPFSFHSLELQAQMEAVLGAPGAGEEPAESTGTLERDEVLGPIQAKLGKIQGCYERSLIGAEQASGILGFAWWVQAEGAVSRVRLVRREGRLADGAVYCIARVIRDLKFPAPRGGGEVRIEYPFMFRTLPRDP